MLENTACYSGFFNKNYTKTMIKKARKLTTKEFEEVFSHGYMIHSDTIMAKVLENPSEIAKFAVVVSKKVQKGAIRRNFLRRKIFSCIARAHSENFLGYSVILIAKKESLDVTKEQLGYEVEKILQKIFKDR